MRPQRSPRPALGAAACALLVVLAACSGTKTVPDETGPVATVEDDGPVADSTASGEPATPVGDLSDAREPDAAAVQDPEPAPQAPEPAPQASEPTTTPPPSDTTVAEAPPRDCSPRAVDDFEITDASPAWVSVEFSQAAFDCAYEVGLAFAADPEAIATLASQDIAGPLLLAGPELSEPLISEIERLAPLRVVAVGIDEQLAAPRARRLRGRAHRGRSGDPTMTVCGSSTTQPKRQRGPSSPTRPEPGWWQPAATSEPCHDPPAR